ncbi:MAG: hypothetical protein LBS81_03225 [Endomicrobium sp.]|jgi:flavodoxin|nr:hypothetical protein [Endomicrobium sp.]
MKNRIIDIYFFTGTGNTYLAAKKISETLSKNKCFITLNDMTSPDPEKINLSNTIEYVFPLQHGTRSLL